MWSTSLERGWIVWLVGFVKHQHEFKWVNSGMFYVQINYCCKTIIMYASPFYVHLKEWNNGCNTVCMYIIGTQSKTSFYICLVMWKAQTCLNELLLSRWFLGMIFNIALLSQIWVVIIGMGFYLFFGLFSAHCYLFCNGLMDHLCLCTSPGSPFRPFPQVPHPQFNSTMVCLHV